MGRPPLPLGTHGEIRTYRLGQKKWRARTLYRDYDGKVRAVERVGPSKAGATTNLREALRDRARTAVGDEITASAKVKVVGELWLRELGESSKLLRA